ncbi:kinase-like domain-containing protein [Rhizophagus diaphanus]|nr:kinase-like domain-containing protein [Rhizophagus diaphanus] [Rhizophagus sp. MUCL 43196]
MDASTSTHVNLSVETVEGWSVVNVKEFLNSKRDYFSLSDTEIGILEKNGINGRAFLDITKEELLSLNVRLGPAKNISKFVAQQKQPSADLKRQFDEMTEKMDNMSRDLKKVRYSEVLWFSAPGTTDTITEKGKTVRLKSKLPIEFPLKLTKTAQKRVYGKFQDPPNVSEKELQEYFINECRPLNTKNSKLVVEDVHSIPLLATRKPDFVFIAKDRPLDALHVVAVGEIKPRSGKGFSNADVGQAITFGEKVLQLQPQRAYVYVVLTDCINIDIYKVTRVHNSNNSYDARFLYGHIKPELLCYPSNGWKYLVTILECNPENLGWLEPSLKFNSDTDIVRLVRSINTGRTSNVYQGKYANMDVVVKLAKDEKYLSCFKREKTVLESLDLPHIPKLHLHDEKSLIMTPLGMKVKSLEKRDIKSIIETLKIVHEKNIVHMDLRRYNFIRDYDEKIIIIDWGYSTTKNETGDFAGALECMPDDILKSLANGEPITYSPRIDLICLVRSFYLMLHKPANTAMERISFDKIPDFKLRAKSVLTFWSSHGKSKLWRKVYQEANNLKYDNLIKALEVLF